MIMPFMRMIVSAGGMKFRGEDTGGFLYGGLRADGAHVARAAVQAFHLAEAREAGAQVVGRGPFDADFLAAAGAVG